MWKVVPIQGPQLLDVRQEDLLNDGLYRKCDTYRGGGGYDKFPAICEKRLGKKLHNQFVVQLYGCPLKCPYCYVTPDGIFGNYKEVKTEDLIEHFIESKQEIFHLMGGAPALYLKNWGDIIKQLPSNTVFHSDFLLIENMYQKEWLKRLDERCLFAVSIKGIDSEDFYKNTGKNIDWLLFWNNLDLLVENKINFYITFTNPMREVEKMNLFKDKLIQRYGKDILNDSFEIKLVQYNALK